MDGLTPNSNKYKNEQKQERERLKPVIDKKSVVSKKKKIKNGFLKLFLPEDVEDVRSYIFDDCIIPGIKNAILDVLYMSFYHEEPSRRERYGRSDYRSMYRGNSYKRSSSSSRNRKRDRDRDSDHIDYRDIVLDYRADAEKIVDELHHRIDDYGYASVADLLDLIDMPGKYTDNDYGWKRKGDIGIKRIADGFLIDVEEAYYIG